MDNIELQPFAEYWLGAHPNHPSITGDQNLAALISFDPQKYLGEAASNFSSLPFLLKILDVRQMLSIQVHPSKSSAEKGFAEENKKGIDIKAPHRNYKDDNHKPEMMVALSNFWLLHGFKPAKPLREVLQKTRELSFLLDDFEGDNYLRLYDHVMFLTQEETDAKLAPLAERVLKLYEAGGLEKSSEDFWAARAIITFPRGDHFDRGIFSIYLFNLLHLSPGEGIFQPEGMPHAYLEGQNVEVMANSDNVLRAGLTDKHIDVPELMKHVNFQPTIPNVLKPGYQNGQRVFDTPAREFRLQEFRGEGSHALDTKGAEIFLLVSGSCTITEGEERYALEEGEAVFVAPQARIQLQTRADTDLFRVSVPGA